MVGDVGDEGDVQVDYVESCMEEKEKGSGRSFFPDWATKLLLLLASRS